MRRATVASRQKPVIIATKAGIVCWLPSTAKVTYYSVQVVAIRDEPG
jgi:hypothetical protein